MASAKQGPDPVKELHEAIDKTNIAKLKDILTAKSGSKEDITQLCSRELQPYGTSLHHAAGSADLEIIQLILDAGVDVNVKQLESHVTQGQAPLHIAALAGKCNVVQLLLSKGADINSQESEGQTALHCACSANNLDTVKVLIQGGANINMADHRKESPLQRSILRSSTEISRFLIDSGADLSVTDTDKQTLLHYAVEWDNMELIEEFIKKGLLVNAQDNDGCSPLHLADTEIMLNLLVKHGGDVNLRDNCGRPPISKRLDVQKEEYKRINEVLERQLSIVDDPSTLQSPSDDLDPVDFEMK